MESYQARDSYLGFLSEFSSSFQMKILEEAILRKLNATGSDESAGATAGRGGAKYQLEGKILDNVLELFKKFNVVVHVGEVRKYKDTVKQFKDGIPASLKDTTPIGYMTSKTVRLYDVAATWFEVSKLSLNRQITYKENEIIIGFLESAEDSTKFKLRKPIQRIREEIQKGRKGNGRGKGAPEKDHRAHAEEKVVNVDDTRLIERGIVCVTKNKPELLQIIASLGISVSKLEKSEIRIKKLCSIIKSSLIESEIRERTKDGRYKYLYGWWDEPIDIAARI